MFAGKDFVAKSANLKIKGFADPIYQLCEFFNGTADKSVPGVRKFLQQIGQWGWGCVSDSYPHTAERAAITRSIREQGATMTRDFGWVNWSEFGKRQDFWVNIALTGLAIQSRTLAKKAQDFLFPEMNQQPGMRLAITNARFAHELQPCLRAGFRHFHVRCSEETRRLRMIAAGYEYRPQDDADTSEALAKQFDSDMQDRCVVWNDNEPAPAGRDYMALDEFVCLHVHATEAQEPAPLMNMFMVDNRQPELVLA